jgi:hypothetical protein
MSTDSLSLSPTTPLASPCGYCRRMRHLMRNDPDNRLIHHNEQVLKVSAAKGCQLCGLFYRKFCVEAPRYASRQHNLRIEQIANATMTVVDFNNTPHTFENTASWTHFRAIERRPDTKSAFDLIRFWLQDCESEHSVCRRGTSGVMPRRLISVTGKLQLLQGQSIRLGEPYGALSHCWGKSLLLKTTTKNVEAFGGGIDWHALPKTFQDAVEVSRRLSIKYLWIDALCILQDDEQDWEREAMKMGDYYRNAHLTISASSAPDGSTGFLSTPRDEVAVRVNTENWREASRPWSDVFEQSPLSRRGWVLQERLLSRRVLHFARDELLWECLTCSARECVRGYLRKNNFKRSIMEYCPVAPTPIEMKSWYSIVCQYTSLDLTYDQDVLTAIAGVVRNFLSITKLQYVSGMWWEHLPYGLLWYCEQAKLPGKSTVAPSWSWGSRRGPVRMLFDPLDYYTTSHMNKRGRDYMAKFHKKGDTEAFTIEAYHTQLRCVSSCASQAPYDDPDLRRIINIFDKTGDLVGTGYWDRPPEAVSMDCTILIMMQRVDSSRDGILYWTRDEFPVDLRITYFLLVVQVGDEHGCKRWERVGIGHNVDPVDKQIFPSKWLENTGKGAFFLV